MAEIVQVYYRASTGEEFPFQMERNVPAGMCGVFREKTVRIKTANFHNWNFEIETQELDQGERVLRSFRRGASYQTQLYIGGPIENRKDLIDTMHAAFERDVRALTPGRLYWRDYYITCFIMASSTYPDNAAGVTVNDIDIYAAYPFWIKEEAYSFDKSSGSGTSSGFLDYNIAYQYDFTTDIDSVGTVENDGTIAAPMLITFFGPANNPKISIGGNIYQINLPVPDGGTGVIDTLHKTVTVTNAAGEVENAFNYRRKTGSEFAPIPIGTTEVIWPGDYDVEITVMKERSEPAWT